MDYWEIAIGGTVSNSHTGILMFHIIAMVLYDWILSLPRESQLFIMGNVRPLSAWLYFVNKYTNIINQLIFVLTLTNSSRSTKVC